jgi:phosphoglycerate dehydrogenase-like enzyme
MYYENEPVTEAQEALINHPRTICTGHYAWYSDRAAQELAESGRRIESFQPVNRERKQPIA